MNPSNEDLQHVGGLGKALLEAGGPSIQQESDEHVRTHGKVLRGGAVCVGASSLPCKVMIHAVGPCWEGGTEGEEQVLHSAVFESLKVAGERSLTSVAFPAIGTEQSGNSNIPPAVCAYTSLKAVWDFTRVHQDTSIRRVKFVLDKQECVNAFKTLLESGVFMENHSPLPVVWSRQWEGEGEKGFLPYYPADSAFVEFMYQVQDVNMKHLFLNGKAYEFDFANMCQICMTSDSESPSPIQRQVSPTAF